MKSIDYDELEIIAEAQREDPAFGTLDKTYVPGEGDNPLAFIVGEAPGAQEAIAKRPFVGAAGVVMRDLMTIAGLRSDWRGKLTNAWVIPNCKHGLPPNCWLTNVVKFHPPGNRNPTDWEIASARQYLRREWVAVGAPRIIIPVGGIALYAFTGRRQSILRAAGVMRCARSRITGDELYVWPMVHPSFGIRNPPVRPLLEKDWERLADWMKTR